MRFKIKHIIATFIAGFILGFICCYCFSSHSSSGASPSTVGAGFITDKVKALQTLVGCEKIDAKIGPETTRLVNAAVKSEERELFNQYAEVYMTPSGAPGQGGN